MNPHATTTKQKSLKTNKISNAYKAETKVSAKERFLPRSTPAILFLHLFSEPPPLNPTPSQPEATSFVSPLPTYDAMSTYFTPYHQAIDLTEEIGAPVVAIEDGTVLASGLANDGYGLVTTINHPNNIQSLYAHLSSLSVSAGETIKRGTQIGQVGCTGNCTGSHLHFAVFMNNTPINPIRYL